MKGERRIYFQEGEDLRGLAGAGAKTGVVALVGPRRKMTGRWGNADVAALVWEKKLPNQKPQG